MFWGLIMEPGKRYSQVVKKSFHISMAALDVFSSSSGPVQLMCGFDDKKYLLCTLSKDDRIQCALDLNFDVGDEICFVTNGSSHVHLTGYLNDELDMNDEEDMEDDEEQNEVVTEVLGNISASNIVTGKRPKKPVSEKLAPPAKKSKTMKMLEEAEHDSDDSEVALSDLEKEEDDTDNDSSAFLDDSVMNEEDSEEESSGEEEEENNEDNNDEEEEEDDEDDDAEDTEEVSSLSEEETTKSKEKPKAKVNGTATKKEKLSPVAQKKQKQSLKKQEETPKKQTVKEEQKTPKTAEKAQKQTPGKTPGATPQKKTVEGGVIIEDLKIGNGAVAKPGKIATVYYTGRLKQNNKVFDSCQKGNGFKFRLGKQEVIKGWDVGVAGMKVGGKRRLIIPANMGYGAKGHLPTIPQNATLVFEVELKNTN